MHVPEDSGAPNALYSSSTLRPGIGIRARKPKGAQNKNRKQIKNRINKNRTGSIKNKQILNKSLGPLVPSSFGVFITWSFGTLVLWSLGCVVSDDDPFRGAF